VSIERNEARRGTIKDKGKSSKIMGELGRGFPVVNE
jgi:hypothetical protein